MVDGFAAAYVLTAAISVMLAAERVSSGRRTVLRRVHVVYLLATAAWSVGALGMLDSVGTLAMWCLPVRLLAQAAVSAAVCCLSLGLSDATWRPGARLITLLSIHPLLVVVAAATNPWHHLVVTGPPGDAAWGPLYWVHVAFCYGFFAVVMGRMAMRRKTTPMLRSGPFSAVIVSWFFPVVGNGVSLVLFGPTGPDLTPPSFLVTAIVVVVSISRGLERLAPIARTRVFESLTDALLVLSPEGTLVDANPAAMELLARADEDRALVMGRPLGELSPGLAALVDAGDGERALGNGDEQRVLDVRETLLGDASGRTLGRLVVLRNVTEAAESRRLLAEAHEALRGEAMVSEQLRDELAEQAVRDAGTGLHNRRHLDARLPWLIEHAGGRPLSVIMADIDHFKRVNDTHGHAAGDRVLRAVAGALDAHAQSAGGEAIRYGGEEFLVLLPGVGVGDAYRLAEAMRRACGDVVVQARSGDIRVTVSAGVAPWSAGQRRAELFAEADAALYEAKCSGRDRTVVAGAAVVASVPS